jgi:thiol-disulfide isomerase/thioredoxin
LLSGCADHNDSIQTADGKLFPLVNGDKRYIAVNYWASWCSSCSREISALNQLSIARKDQVIILGVNFDRQQGPALRSDIEKFQIHYPVVVSDLPEKWGLPEPDVLPTTYLLTPEHRLIKTFYGEKTAQDLDEFLGHPD